MISYNAAPLHHLYPKVIRESEPAEPSGIAMSLMQVSRGSKVTFVTHPVMQPTGPRDDILIWRDRFNEDNLPTAPALWDELSDVDVRRGVYPHADVLLKYVGAVLSLRLDSAALHISSGAYDDIRQVLTDERLGLDRPRYAQIVFVQDLWLPTPFDLLVRDNDWCGRSRSFGSSYLLSQELSDIRSEMVGISPALEAIPDDGSFRCETVLDYAWEASSAMSDICDRAIKHNLPFYTEGR